MFKFRLVDRKEEDNRKEIRYALTYEGNNLLKLRTPEETFIIYCQGYKNITPRLIRRLKDYLDLDEYLHPLKEDKDDEENK